MDIRLQSLQNWLATVLPGYQLQIAPLAGDASFRRYFRVRGTPNGSDKKRQPMQWVVMDAPVEKENCAPFIAIANAWHAQGINVPEIHALDTTQGFILLSDFGDGLYLPALNDKTADALYNRALQTLIHIQQTRAVANYSLPPYDEALLAREMALFKDWLIEKKLGLTLSTQESELLADTFAKLIANATEQPQVPVHRDYHSRNLMICEANTPGVLDFQDAVIGPITYDLVSLLKDCYIVWPEKQVTNWAEDYLTLAQSVGLTSADKTQFLRWFELMGMQRHLKASGIFARLSMRDGKHGYLADIPRTVDYIVSASSKFSEFADFTLWLKERVVPKLTTLGTPSETANA
jgi:hypothetical protein